MNTALQRAIIIDLDGTLANVEHRIHHVRGEGKKNWKKFFEGMAKDEPMEWCRFLTNNLPATIILLTGRPADYEIVTREWLKAKEIKYDILLMRNSGDFRPDTIVKKEIYESRVKDFFDVLFVVEDREAVVKMWRDLGLVCLQCHEESY